MKPQILILIRAGCCVLLLISAAGESRAQAPTGAQIATKASLDELAWIAGAWTGTLGDRTIEQHWTAPLGGSMLAMYRSIRADRATLYELLAIEQGPDGIVLRIKHFAPGPGLVSQEAKDQSVDHRLVSLEGRTATFEGTGTGNPARITFSSPDVDTLTISVEREREGKRVTTDFKYSRLPR